MNLVYNTETHVSPLLLRFLALIFPFVFVAYTAPALPGPALADAPAFSLSSKDLLSEADAAAGSVASPAVVLLDDEHWTFQDANHIEHRRHYIVKVLDSSAIQLFSGVQERWESWHEQRPTVRARVVTGDGTVHELDAKSLVDAPAGTSLPQAYSDVRVIQGPLPAVEVGSVVEVETTQTSQPALGSLVFRGYVAGAVPVRLSRLVLDYPQSVPMRYRTDLCPDAKESKTTEKGRVHLSLMLGAFESVGQVDELLPFDAPRVPSVTFSTGTSWNDLARTYNDLVDKQIAEAPVTALVSRVIGKETDRRVIVDKLMHALHNEVRYTGVEFGEAAIVPAKPADTLSRKYGDCKDKASLLVAMLRQAGIPASVAILNSGLDEDVSPDYPGMGMFNHAIVYVPGAPALWIDATAAHTALGTLPPSDEGRLALIVRNDTTALTEIPESRSSANVSNTLRAFELPDFGPAHVSQTVSGTGIYDSTFREFFAAEENDEFRKNLQQQTQAEWETKSPIEITHPPVDDFTKPFALKVDIHDAKSVTISETGGSIPFQPGSVLSGLPRYFLTPEDKNDQSKKVRTVGFVLPAAFIEKSTYRVQLPAGFVVRQMPQNQTVPLGPASYSAHYKLDGQILTAELSFDSGKRTYSLEEGNQLRKAVLDFMKQPPPVLAVEPRGQALLDDGKLRDGLDAFRDLASQHPNQAEADAINHVRLARAYLSVGCGQQARDEAQLAAKTAPALAVTWRAVAFVNEHDLIGRKFKPGWDPAVTESALRKAMSLDKDDTTTQTELAETLEYTSAGVRYGSMTRVRQAADTFEAMGDDKVEQQGDQDLLLWDLAYLGDFDTLTAKLQRFGVTGSRIGVSVFLDAAKHGGAKAAANLKTSYSPDQVKTAVQTARYLLTTTGRYSEAADLLSEVDADTQAHAAADALRQVHRIDPASFKPDTPEHVVEAFYAAEYDPDETIEQLRSYWSKLILERNFDRVLTLWRRFIWMGATMQDVPLWVERDTNLSMVKKSVEQNGDDYRVRQFAGNRREWLGLISEDGHLRILGNAALPDGVAHRAIALAKAGKLDEARKWLDWVREDVKIASEDDALGGPVFPRVWTKGQAATADQIRFAAALLLNDGDEALPALQAAAAAANSPITKGYYQLAIAQLCVREKKWANGLDSAKALYAAYPNSQVAIGTLANILAGMKRFDEAEKVLRTAMANNSDDLNAKRLLVFELGEANQMQQATTMAKEITESPDATGVDWNQYGWMTLFVGQVDEQKIHAVERAQTQPSPGIQQTIASMYAEIGQLNEARQLSLQSLERFGLQTPDSSWWYVFARIAEQLNVPAAAKSFYAKVENDEGGSDATSVYTLSQIRVGAMK